MDGTMSKKDLIIFGLGDFSEIAYEYFQRDSGFRVIGFTVEGEFQKCNSKFGLPVYAFESLAEFVNPNATFFYCAVLYNQMNDTRTRIINSAEVMGFSLASYISSNAFVWDQNKIGEHCFIFEDNTIQPFAEIGRNCILWSGNHIGHHSVIGENSFISSHVVVSGATKLGRNCFVGVNATLTNAISIGERTWISMGSLVTKDVPSGSLVLNDASKIVKLNETLLERKLGQISKARTNLVN
jgi:sugar O-acyltransferase (sialic acid O-acetyltransferase NeuD family)